MKSIGWDTSFHLNGKFPLLDNSIFPSLNAARLFISDPTSSAIAGTIIGVDDPSNSNETGLYEIFNNSGELALRKLVSEGTLSGYQTKIDSLITDLSSNYSSELAELAAQLAKLLETLRDEMFSPDNDTTPVTRTMMLLVGADSTNYRFSTNEIGSKDTDGVVFNSSDKSLTFLSGTLYHFSITDDSGKPRTWSIPDSSYIELEGAETSLGKYMNLQDYVNKGESLWVYLKVSKTGLQGNWFLSPTKYGCILDDTQLPGEGISLGNTAYYYLLYGYCGVTSSLIPFFEPIYGNTWIKGSTIYTGKVQTMDGYSALDLDNNTLKLGNDFYYSDGQVVVGNPDTGAFVFHKHGGSDTALHVGTMTKDSNGNESWNGMTFANGELTIGKYDEKLQEMQTQLDKEVSTWYGLGIPLPYKETEEGNIIDSVNSDLAASYNNNTLITENGIKKFNLSPSPELLSYHINDIYINTITGTGYRLVVTNYGTETQSVYWLQLSQGDLLNILNLINSVNSEVNNIKTALDITEDGLTTIGDKFIETMMLRIGADSTNYTLSKTSTSGNRMKNLQWSIEGQNVKLNVLEGENLHHSVYYWVNTIDKSKIYDWTIAVPTTSILSISKTFTTPYYLYIKCSKTSNTAEWLATNTARSLLDSLWYYFPFGTVVDPSTKTLVEVRGNTKIIGDRIITGKLESNTGNSFFDLDNGQFALGIDLNNPNDLDKAAFSFDGNKVHIGGNLGLEYKWNLMERKSIEFSVSSIPTTSPSVGTLEGFRKRIFTNLEPGTYKIAYNDTTDTSSTEYPYVERTFGNDPQKPYFICIGAPTIDNTTNKILNSIKDFIEDGDMFVEIVLNEPSDLYIIRGRTKDNGKTYELVRDDGDNHSEGWLSFRISNLTLYKLIPIIEDLGLRASLSAGSTDISGGLVLTNCLGVRNSAGIVTAGINGIHDNNNKTAFWAGSNIDEKEAAPVKITADGIGSKIGPLTVKDQDSVTIEGEGPDLLFINSVSGNPKSLSLSGKYLEKDLTDSLADSTDYFKLPASSLAKGEYKKNVGNSQNTFTLFSLSISINNKFPLEYYNNTFSGTITPNVFNGIQVSFTKSSFSEPWYTTISMYYNLKLVVSNGSYTLTIFDMNNWWIKYECNSNDSAATYTIPIAIDTVNLNKNILKPGTVKVSLLFTINKFYRVRAASSWSYWAGNPVYNNLDITITRPNIDLGGLLSILRDSDVKSGVNSPKLRSEIGMNGFRFKYGDALFNARIINYKGELESGMAKPHYGNLLIINLSGLPVIQKSGVTEGTLIIQNGILYVVGSSGKGLLNKEVGYDDIETNHFIYDSMAPGGPQTPIA